MPLANIKTFTIGTKQVWDVHITKAGVRLVIKCADEYTAAMLMLAVNSGAITDFHQEA